ncbi:MAG TPA: flavin reductase family protein [Burkholderiaceae bacterium]|nr:flavin reductase family protein [Burkholderiaceae bacterium]
MSSTVDPKSLRAALGGFATGVALVTCRDAAGRPVGLTVNSFNALSLDPPLVLWSLRLASPSLAAFDAAPQFAINVLSEGQVELSRRFASALPAKFEQGVWHEGYGGAPLLAGACVQFECERVDAQTAGDHRLYIGRVRQLQAQPVPPLVFHGGHYHLLGEVL